MPRTDMKALMSMPVPLPPLDEQRRIVDILNRAARIETLRTRAAERLREFGPALFVKMFGDPIENPMGWLREELGSLGTLDRGRSRHRPRNAPELYGGPYPFVQTGDIANSKAGCDSNGAKSNARGRRLVSLAVSVRLRRGPCPSRSGTSRRG